MESRKGASKNSQNRWRAELISLVRKLVEGRIQLADFESRYYDFYIEQVPDSALTEREHEFFGLIQEALDWTTVSPTVEDRGFGWMDEREYRDWVQRLVQDYEAGAELRFWNED